MSATTKNKGRTTDRGRWGERASMRDGCRDKESKEISSRVHERTRDNHIVLSEKEGRKDRRENLEVGEAEAEAEAEARRSEAVKAGTDRSETIHFC